MELLRFIHDTVFQVAGYATGRIVLTILFAGRLRVQPLTKGIDDPFPWHGLRRAPDGVLEASDDTAELVGALTWVVIAIAAVITLGRL